MRNTLRNYHSELCQQTSDLISLRRTGFHERVASTVQREHGLLLHVLDRHEPHIRPSNCFADRLGVSNVILIVLRALLNASTPMIQIFR